MWRSVDDLVVRPPHLTDIGALAARMRAADIEECRAFGVEDLQAAVEDSVRQSSWVRAAIVGHDLACIFGVVPRGTLITNTGAPWLLGTDTLIENRGAFMRLAPQYIAAMLSQYSRLENLVHARNTKAIAWLKRSGFALAPATFVGPTGESFYTFSMG